jgi:hypothetical protein
MSTPNGLSYAMIEVEILYYMLHEQTDILIQKRLQNLNDYHDQRHVYNFVCAFPSI